MSTGDQPVGMDADALAVTGHNFRSSAGAIKDHAQKVVDSIVDKAHVGAGHADEGGKIANGLREVEAWLNEWSEATKRTGDAIGQDVVTISEVDTQNSNETQKAAS